MNSNFKDIEIFLLATLPQDTTRLFAYIALQVKYTEDIESAH